MLTWGAPDERYYHHGVDRGVLYTSDRVQTGISPSIEEPLSDSLVTSQAFPWNGIIGFEESGNGDSSIYYIDGRVYLADVDATDFSGKLDVYDWPKEFAQCVGMPQAAPGLFVDNQKPKPFDFSYRTLVGSGLGNDRFGHQIHLVYRAMASIGSRSRRTINEGPEPTEFSFNLSCTPVTLPGYRPSAHYVIDTRYLDLGVLETLEGILYGDGINQPRMPKAVELYDLLKFSSAITFRKWTHPVLGAVWTATGSSANLKKPTPDTYQILNVNGSWIDETQGHYALQDTP